MQANLPTNSFGTTTKMYVANRSEANYHQDGLIKFDLHSIPVGEIIASATLQLTVNQQNGDSQTAYYALSDTWGETVTWNTRPPTGASIATWNITGLGAVTADVTSAAQAQINTTNKRLSMYIKGTDLTKQTAYWTRE